MINENVALVSEISASSGLMAHIEKFNSYQITFDVVGEIGLDLRLKTETGKLLKGINNVSSQFIAGSYEFPLTALQDGYLHYNAYGKNGAITNIKVIRRGKKYVTA